jgi:pimeloyl-ACP methyl ester carboxylesterase
VKHLVIAGMRLEYVDHPARTAGLPTILMLHEGLGCVAMWRHFPQQVAMITGCRVIAWSRAGYGHSQPYAKARTARYMHREALEQLPALLAELQVTRPLLFGHSDGASIALIFAGAFPDVPLGVIAMAPHEFVEEKTLTGITAAKAAWTATDLPHKLARHHADAPRVFAKWNDCWLAPDFAAWNIEEYLPVIRCPVLAIQGEDDEYATMRQIDVIAEQVPDTMLLKLSECGHSPHRDQPEVVLWAVDTFVKRMTGRTAGQPEG